MRNVFRMLARIIGRAALAVTGLFLVFDAWLVASWASNGFGTFIIPNLWAGPWFVLEFPFTELLMHILLSFSLILLPLFPNEALGALDIKEYAFSILAPLARYFAFFLVIIAAIAVFERRRGSDAWKVIAFYGIALPIVWFATLHFFIALIR